MNTYTLPSRCHLVDGGWYPEEGSPAWHEIKATPLAWSATTAKRRRAEKKAAKVSEPVAPVETVPDIPLPVMGIVPYRTACDELGLLPTHVAQLVALKKVKGNAKKREVSMGSLIAYMETR